MMIKGTSLALATVAGFCQAVDKQEQLTNP